MAINFPNAPVNGTTYDYLGVRYVWKDTGGGTGLWVVSTPGTYGVASSAEIDAGTDPVKYVTPLGLEDSDYLHSGEIDTAIDAKIAAIPASIYHGPVDYSGTGPGTTPWEIGDIPTGAKKIDIDFYNVGFQAVSSMYMGVTDWSGSTSEINSGFGHNNTTRVLNTGSIVGLDSSNGRLTCLSGDGNLGFNGQMTLTHHSNFVGGYLYNVTGTLHASNRGFYRYGGIFALSDYARTIRMIGGTGGVNWDGYSEARITSYH